MKRILIGALITALLLSAFSAAFAEPLCKASEVDLSGVQEIDGRLVGEIRVPDGLLNGQVRIDCPLPEGFTQEQSQKLTVQYKCIDEQEMLSVLKAIGQKGTPDTIYIYNSDPDTFAEFSLQKYGDPGYCYFWGNLMDAEASADPAYTTEYVQAKSLVQTLIAQLGGTADQKLLHATRFDIEHFYPYSTSASSDGITCKARAVEAFKQTESKYGLIPNTLTTVSGPYKLYGLPVMRNITWMDGSDRMGAGSAYYAAVHDDGTLQYCMVQCLPVVTDTETVSLPVRGWRELLAECVANGWCLSNADREDSTYEDFISGDTVTVYASYAIITELHPCWYGNDKHTMVPGYYMSIEQRVARDDSLSCLWENYGDAETLTSIY